MNEQEKEILNGLKHTIESLKCCGNCKERSSYNMGNYYGECCKIKNMGSHGYCYKWEYDHSTNKDRRE